MASTYADQAFPVQLEVHIISVKPNAGHGQRSGTIAVVLEVIYSQLGSVFFDYNVFIIGGDDMRDPRIAETAGLRLLAVQLIDAVLRFSLPDRAEQGTPGTDANGGPPTAGLHRFL